MRFTLFILIFVFVAACGTKKEHETGTAGQATLREQIRELQQKTSNGKESRKDLLELIKLYKQYADSFPNDKLAPVGLMNAADCYGRLRMQNERVALYKLVVDKYPNHKDADLHLYLYASALDSDLDMREEAKKQYQLYIEKYPNSTYINDAKYRLTTIDSLSFKELEQRLMDAPTPPAQ